MDQRLAVLMCGLMCFGIEAQDVPKIEPRFDPITVALVGEILRFDLTVLVPKNQTPEWIKCCQSPCYKFIYTKEVPSHIETFSAAVNLTATNSSDSGEYSCAYKTAKVYWVVLVRDEGYREPAPDNSILICIGSLTAGLFLFSIIGSTVLCKDYRDSENDGEEMDGNRKVKDESIEDAANSESLYMGLERSTSSIYTVLDSATPAKETNQKKVERRETKEASKMQKAQKEDVIESVYENY